MVINYRHQRLKLVKKVQSFCRQMPFLLPTNSPELAVPHPFSIHQNSWTGKEVSLSLHRLSDGSTHYYYTRVFPLKLCMQKARRLQYKSGFEDECGETKATWVIVWKIGWKRKVSGPVMHVRKELAITQLCATAARSGSINDVEQWKADCLKVSRSSLQKL